MLEGTPPLMGNDRFQGPACASGMAGMGASRPGELGDRAGLQAQSPDA